MLLNKSCFRTASSSFRKQFQSVNSGIEHKETIGTSLQIRKILLLQMIKDIKNEAQYLNGFTLLVSYEDHRREGILLSISELKRSNHNKEKLKLRGKSKQRRKMRKELLGRYDVSNYDDQSIEYLIENLIELEKSLIAE